MCLVAVSGQASAAGHVYLIKGAFGIFSYGLTTLGEELRARGYNASVHDTTEISTIASEATNLQKRGGGPIVIVAHSIGANAAVTMAETMQGEGGSVALIVAFGPTFDMQVPSNVSRAIVYYQANGVVKGRGVRGSGFRGSITNINVDSHAEIDHFNIEKNERLHASVIADVQAVLGGHRSPRARSAKRRR